jgi:predicted 3-demethylubiquinone-9 3-methyltransferase (glyoxalase superfamily)
MKNPIYPCLWFDGQAEEAAKFYTGIFKNSKILSSSPMVTMFELNGNKFMGLNGGPHFKFNEAVSFVVNCENQKEIDFFWEKLISEGGNESMCGWLKDKYGVSWQIIPASLPDLMKDPGKAQRVMDKVMKMKKLDVATLENA